MTLLSEVIENGPNRFSRILGHASVDGHRVRIQVRVAGFYHARVEYTDATRENDAWHMIGGNFALNMPFHCFLRALPVVAALELTPAILAALKA